MVEKQIGTSIECYALRGTLLSKIWTTSKAPRKDAGYLQISAEVMYWVPNGCLKCNRQHWTIEPLICFVPSVSKPSTNQKRFLLSRLCAFDCALYLSAEPFCSFRKLNPMSRRNLVERRTKTPPRANLETRLALKKSLLWARSGTHKNRIAAQM